MATLDDSPLGRATGYPERYDPALLFALLRAPQREAIGIRDVLPFAGVDRWTAYEISWLDLRGKPEIAIGRFDVPADSPAIVESKSLKLYLGSFAQERIASSAALAEAIETDLNRACGSSVRVALIRPARFGELAMGELTGESLDGQTIAIEAYDPAPDALVAGGPVVDEALRSSLFRSNCPVTGQPDFGDVLIRYRGPRIDRAGLFRYLVSYRRHAGFHEHCVERIFVDVAERCGCERLTVYARFTRRGGIDISPFRSNFESTPVDVRRTPRQ